MASISIKNLFVKQMYSHRSLKKLKKLVRKPLATTSVDSILYKEKKKKNRRRRRKKERKIRSNSKETVFFFLFRLFSIPPLFFPFPPRFFSFHTSNRDKGKIKGGEKETVEVRSVEKSLNSVSKR